jgi:heme-degrading monooxygenase HmoA
MTQSAILCLGLFVVGHQLAPVASLAQEARAPNLAGTAQASTASRLVLVEWRIKKGREQEFLDYWSTRATVEDRSGLIGEFLSKVEDQKQYPWMVWDLDPAYTTYVNVGFWRDGDAFQQQIGRFIDNSKPPQDFEAQKRRRVLVAPERWRMGATPWTFTDHPSVR